MFSVVDIALSCVVALLLIIIGLLIWRLRRAASDTKPTPTSQHGSGAVESPRDQKVTEPGTYMELKNKLSDALPPIPSENQAPSEKCTAASVYENVACDKVQEEEVYVEIGNSYYNSQFLSQA